MAVVSEMLECPLCGEQAVEEVGESGTFWDHCHGCRVDDPFYKAAATQIREAGSFNLGMLAPLKGERFERTLEALTAEFGDMKVHYDETKGPPKSDPF